MNELLQKLQLQKGVAERREGQLAFDEDIEKAIAGYIQGEASVAAWFDHKMVWGSYKNGQLSFADGEKLAAELLLELRVFNVNEELYIRRGRSSFVCRYIADGTGDVAEYVDCLSRLWGQVDRSQAVPDGFIKLCDKDRKLVMTVPADDTGADYFGLLTRNYVDYDDKTGQAGYRDYRFVAVQEAGRD